jgi:HTH-type transcriptional regulator/antitoxin HigA
MAFMESAEQIPHAARKSTSYEDATPLQRAWLARAAQLAPGVAVEGAFAQPRLPELIQRLRILMLNAEDVRIVPRLLADFGVRLLIVEPLAGSRIDGATFWIDAKSPVIVLSLRYDRIDYFWYTLLHELAHVKNQDGLRLDSDLTAAVDETKPEAEARADALATATVVPQGELEDFISRSRPIYSAVRIQAFAKRIKIHPGIIVGQLHHRGEIGYRILRQLLVPIRQIVTRAALTDGWSVDLPPLDSAN